MSILAQHIISALHLLAYTGECAEAKYYTDKMPAATIGYVTIDNCVLPTIAEMSEQQILDTYLDLVGD